MKAMVKDNAYLIALVLIVLSVVIIKFISQAEIGPGWDTYSFSINALEYAGKGTGYYEYDRGPFFPFVVSMFYRAGLVSEKTTMFVDAMFLFMGSVVLYKLVAIKCPKTVAFLSGLIYATADIMVLWCAVGYADIASVSLSILAIYLFIRGMEDNPRFFLLSWPVAMCAFLSRTTAALIILPMFFYYIFFPFKYKVTRYNILGMLAGVAVYAPVAWFYSVNKGDPIYYIKMVLEGLSATGDSIGMDLEMYNQGPYYYIEQLGNYIVNSNIYPVLAAFVVVGLVLLVFRYLSVSVKRPNSFLLLVFFVGVFYYAYGRFSFKVLEMLLLLLFMYFYYYTRPKVSDNRALFCLMMAFWGVSYFLFHSSFFQKVPRYYVTMMPGLAFIISMSVYELGRVINIVYAKKAVATKVLTVFVVASFLLTSAQTVDGGELGEEGIQFYDDTLDMAQWVNENIDDLDEALIYSDYWVAFGWHFKQTVLSMPTFFDGGYFNHELMKYGVDYYLTYRSQDFPSCEELYSNENIRLLKLVEIDEKPKGLYVGSGWENYFEYLMDFECYLYQGTTHIRQGSMYIDDYTLEELCEYDFIALFDFKWYDSDDTELLLRQYTEQGGTVFIDCSGNLDDPVFSLNYVQFFDMLIYRNDLPAYSQIVFNDTPTQYGFSTFSYGDASWYGATYTPVWSSASIETVATVNDEILVAIESIGDGEIVWMGYNIVYHAFLYDNPSEMEFLQYIFEITVGS